jgi:hypothetical protein
MDEFWRMAISGRWVMSWDAWKILTVKMGGLGVCDDDSGIRNGTTNVGAVEAKRAFQQCTVGPACWFK